MQDNEIKTLKQLWQDGINSGPSQFADITALKATARNRRKEKVRNRADG